MTSGLICAVDVVGCDIGEGGRRCTTHAICGSHVQLNDVLVFRDQVEAEEGGELVHVVKAYTVRDGSQLCHVGYLPRRLLSQRAKYVNKFATVVEDLRISSNAQKRRRSERAGGILRCMLLCDIEHQFRE